MKLTPLPAFSDNYIWLLHDGRDAVVVDPGDAGPVLEALQQARLRLHAILVTHHHPDHTGGVAALREATDAQVYGPARERIPEPFQSLAGGDTIELLGHRFGVIDVPGDTLSNLRFARSVEPDNPQLIDYQGQCERQPARGLPTLPATLATEREINPFLRSREPGVLRAMRAHAPGLATDEAAVFAALREWKNQFQ